MNKKELAAVRKILDDEGYKDINFLGDTSEKENGDKVSVVSFMYTTSESYVPEYATVKIPLSRIKENM